MTKFFLDSGDPKETKEALAVLGQLDGQTTNPSLIAKNPDAVGKKFSESEIQDFYQRVVGEISAMIPSGSVSIEVYADLETTAEQMVRQGRQYNTWIPNAHIKLPITKEGLRAANVLVLEGINVNMTLCFSQEQAAAVYAATKGAKKGQVFLSPFVGRLDDIGFRGMDLVENILKMYSKASKATSLSAAPDISPRQGREGSLEGVCHVEVLAASIRSLGHMDECIKANVDIITAPLKILKEWQILSHQSSVVSDQLKLKPIAYKQIDLNQAWDSFDIQHELTDKGLKKFAEDWNNLIAQK